MLTAVIRGVSPRIGECQLTYMERQAIDYEKACQQHSEYQRFLEAQGLNVISLPPELDFPDGVFVEDTAVVVEEVAVVCIPARQSRRGEVHSLAGVLENFRALKFLEGAATLEGGDVIIHDKTCFVGSSGRTNQQGVQQLREILRPYDYDVRSVPITGCLHLSTGASSLGERTILANPDWIDVSAFSGYEIVPVPPHEPWAANLLHFGNSIVMPAAFPDTGKLLQERGFDVHTVDISEFMKAEAGVTCMSLIFEPEAGQPGVLANEIAGEEIRRSECYASQARRGAVAAKD